MGYEKMENLKEMICRELDEIADKDQLSAGDLDTVNKLVVTKEKLLRIEEIENDLGYSNDGEWRANGSYGNGYSRGRHYVRGHYSYAEGRDRIMSEMGNMMRDNSLSSHDRERLSRAMDALR